MYEQERLRRLIQFRVSPLLDLVLSLLVHNNPERFGTGVPWAQRVRGRVPDSLLAALQEWMEREDLFALALELEDGPSRTVTEHLDALRRSQPELTDLLGQYWEALAPELAARTGLLARSAQRQQERLQNTDPVAFLTSLSDRIGVVGDGEAIILHWGKGLQVPLAELRRILLIPSAFCPRRLMFYRLGETQLLFYQATTPDRRDEEAIPERMLLVFSALADPTRLRLLRLIARESLPAQEMARRLEVRESTVSRHLRLLVEAGVVAKERQEGRYIYYTLEEERIDELLAHLKRYLGR